MPQSVERRGDSRGELYLFRPGLLTRHDVPTLPLDADITRGSRVTPRDYGRWSPSPSAISAMTGDV
jgi:hypothetical protein